jgi:hypothetical protein
MVANWGSGERGERRIGRSLAVTAFVGLFALVVTTASTASFSPATNFPAGSFPGSVATGDLNGDGSPDLAVANTDSGNVSVLLGTGTGSFGAATNFAVGSEPRSVAISNLNGDTFPDLAVANSGLASNNVSVLLGTGTGSFGAATNFAAGTNPNSVAVGDVNGDGVSDLAVANAGSANVSILLGTGAGAFGTATNFPVGLVPRSVVIGNLNAGTSADLAVANSGSNNVSVLPGTGTGTFGAATDFGVGNTPFSVAIGNLNGDGFADLVAANLNSSNVSVLLGASNGSFSTATNFPAGVGANSVAIGNLNGDGFADLAVTSTASSEVSVLLGTGTGSFGVATSSEVGTTPSSVAIGDLDLDSNPDLAVSNADSNNVSVLLNRAPEATATPAGLSFGSRETSSTSPAKTVTVTNASGGDPMTATGVAITGADAGDFLVSGNTCFALPLPLSATCEMSVTFTPSASGARSASLEIAYNGGASPLTVPLSGTGAKARISKLTVTGPATLRKGRPATYKAKITNSGNAKATGVRLIASGRGIRLNSPVGTINAGTTRTVKLRVRPSRTGRVKATFRVTSGNAGSKTVRKTVRVR